LLRLHYLDCEDQSVRLLIENAVELSRKGASGVLFSRRQEYQLSYGNYWNPYWESNCRKSNYGT